MIKLPESPHADTLWKLYEILESSPEGIESTQVAKRLRKFGPNTLKEEQRSLAAIFLGQFKSPIVAILIAAALLSYGMGHPSDSMIILGIVVVNSLLGFFQEYRAETSIRALKKLTETHVRVVRMGIEAILYRPISV